MTEQEKRDYAQSEASIYQQPGQGDEAQARKDVVTVLGQAGVANITAEQIDQITEEYIRRGRNTTWLMDTVQRAALASTPNVWE